MTSAMLIRSICFALIAASSVLAQGPNEANYDESKIPAYTLPDPLVMRDGRKVDSAAMWREERRPEILRLFRENVYGVTPDIELEPTYDVFEESTDALGGKAHRKQVRISFTRNSKTLSMDLLLYTPADADGPVPAFVGLNFQGNYTVDADPAIRITDSWVRDRPGIEGNKADPALRGAAASRWPLEQIVSAGYGVATIYYGDIDPDFDDGFKNGIHALFPEHQDGNFSSIGAWSWGLSRALDYLETDSDVDGSQVAVIGHSRLGKTSLWAGATDERFALVISNDSGCGGAALSRRRIGETVNRINTSFPHWFNDAFVGYNNNENELPVDQHMLLALVAPRPLYVASATEDLWSDPHGEFLSLIEAGPVFKLLGKRPLKVTEEPPPGEATMSDVAYHIRAGKHDITSYDWGRYIEFFDMHRAPR